MTGLLGSSRGEPQLEQSELAGGLDICHASLLVFEEDEGGTENK